MEKAERWKAKAYILESESGNNVINTGENKEGKAWYLTVAVFPYFFNKYINFYHIVLEQ